MSSESLLVKMRNYYHETKLNENIIINKVVSNLFEFYVNLFHLLPKKKTINQHGVKMILSFDKKYGSFNRYFGLHETEQIEFFKKSIKSGDIIFDLGANEGDYSLTSAKMTGRLGKVFAFEPDPSRVKILEKNIDLNSFNQIEIIPIAISDKIGNISFENGYCSEKIGKNTIKTISLDDFIENNNITPNRIKIDVEGFELNVIKGMKKFLDRNTELFLLIEIHPQFISGKKKDIVELITILLEKKFLIKDWETKNEINSNSINEFTHRKNAWHVIATNNSS